VSALVDQLVPDLGAIAEAEIIEVLVKPGERVSVDAGLVTLETEKATMDVPATVSGVVRDVLVSKGQKVISGTAIARIERSGTGAGAAPRAAAAPAVATAAPEVVAAAAPVSPAAEPSGAPLVQVAAQAPAEPAAELQVPLVVLGAGPGGYTAAFRAADLGLQVLLVERWPTLGGVCLNVGCIPSKALLHAAKVIDEAEAMAACGIRFGAPAIELNRLRGWKDRVVGRLTQGLAALAKQRKVEVLRGTARFVSPHRLAVTLPDGRTRIVGFEQCIVAAGSEPVKLPGIPEDPRVIDSSGALALADIPKRLLVIGGGIIGLEMACVYDAIGSKVTVAELTPGLIPGCDRDLVKPLEKRIRGRYEAILTGTRVTKVEARKSDLRVSFEGADAPEPQRYDRVLVAVGRVPNGRLIGADAAGITLDARGFIPVDGQMRTNVPHIFAIGDIVGPPMLAHKATHEAKVAAEVAAGGRSAFVARAIPSVAYTDPEIAWVGVTEEQAKAQGLAVEKGVFPWAASGRALSIARDEGMTKLLFDPATHRVIGGGIVGPNAGELVAEIALAIEMGADAADIGLTVHAHPTLSETVAMAAEAFEGTLTDLYLPKKR